MSRLFPRRAFLQSVLASAASAATAGPRARPKPKPEEPGAPFQIECGRILVETAFVTPDGGSRRALAFFNMGMGRTALAPALHAELGLDRGAPLRYSLAGAAFETPADTVDVAKADFITGLSLNQMFDPMKVEAMLSPSLLRDRVLVLDYGRRRLVVAEPGRIVPEGAAAPIELNPQTGLATVERRHRRRAACLRDRRRKRLLLDARRDIGGMARRRARLAPRRGRSRRRQLQHDRLRLREAGNHRASAGNHDRRDHRPKYRHARHRPAARRLRRRADRRRLLGQLAEIGAEAGRRLARRQCAETFPTDDRLPQSSVLLAPAVGARTRTTSISRA